MTNPGLTLPLLGALARLAPRSIKEIAAAVGFERTHLVHALAGRRPLPDTVMTKLLKELHLDAEGRPDTEVVHGFLIRPRGGTLEDLRLTIPWYFPEGAEAVVVLPEGMSSQDLRRTDHIWGFRSEEVRLIVRRTFATLFEFVPFLLEKELPGIRIRGGGWERGGLMHVPDYPAWQEGGVDISAFDSAWSEQAIKRWTWDDVQRIAKAKKLGPEAVIRMIEGRTG